MRRQIAGAVGALALATAFMTLASYGVGSFLPDDDNPYRDPKIVSTLHPASAQPLESARVWVVTEQVVNPVSGRVVSGGQDKWPRMTYRDCADMIDQLRHEVANADGTIVVHYCSIAGEMELEWYPEHPAPRTA